MIARNDRMQIGKRLAKQRRQSQAHQQASAQSTLFAILWQLITKQAERSLPEGEELDGPTAMVIPLGDLKDIPANFALRLQGDDENLTVVAGLVEPKSNIILPGAG